MQIARQAGRSGLPRRAAIVAICAAALGFLSTAHGLAQNDEANVPAKSPTSEPSIAIDPYLRLDFQIKGSSCVTCIRRVVKALKSLPGVAKADVSIYYPHWAVVILDRNKSDPSRVVTAVRKERVEMVRMTRQYLKEIPLVVMPRPATDAPKRF